LFALRRLPEQILLLARLCVPVGVLLFVVKVPSLEPPPTKVGNANWHGWYSSVEASAGESEPETCLCYAYVTFGGELRYGRPFVCRSSHSAKNLFVFLFVSNKIKLLIRELQGSLKKYYLVFNAQFNHKMRGSHRIKSIYRERPTSYEIKLPVQLLLLFFPSTLGVFLCNRIFILKNLYKIHF